ncbi:MFS transporter [Nonomuraea pusilla]|uniref:MFS transporter n=1 Tax=Nonomuraea pusilla TaxID=46177 RepID=UPI00332B42B7
MRRWWPLTAVCLGSFMLIVDTTVVTVALPDMAGDIHASLGAMQWVMNIYTLALGVLTLSAGSIGDLFGHRTVYAGSVALFALASLACGLAANENVLIAARGVQGIGGAAMFVTSIALLGTQYSDKARGVAIGVWSAVVGAAAAVGPVFGGLLIQFLGWRAIFFVNLPLSLVTLALTLAFVTATPRRAGATVDGPGILAFGVCSGLLTYALISAGDEGFARAQVIVLLVASAAALAAFILIERRRRQPMLDLGLFRSRSFSSLMFCVTASAWAFACLVFTSVWLQSLLGLSPLQSGAVLLPLAVTSFLVSTFVGRVLHKVSPRVTIGLSLFLLAVGSALVSLMLRPDSGWPVLLPGLAIIGAGVGIGIPAGGAAVLASVPPERAGMGSGTMASFRQLGQSLGVAVLGLVFQAGAGAWGGGGSGIGASVESVAKGLRPVELVQAGASGLSRVYVVSAVVAAVGFVLAVSFIRKPPAVAPAEPVPAAPAER